MNANIKSLKSISDDLAGIASSFGNTGNKYMEATLMDIANKINQEALTILNEDDDILKYATVEVTFTESPEMPDLHDKELRFYSVNKMIWPTYYTHLLEISTDVMICLDYHGKGKWCLHDQKTEGAYRTSEGVIAVTQTEDWEDLNSQGREKRIAYLIERLNKNMLGNVFDFTIKDGNGNLITDRRNYYSYCTLIEDVVNTLIEFEQTNVAVVGEAGGWANLEQKMTEAGINVVQL